MALNVRCCVLLVKPFPFRRLCRLRVRPTVRVYGVDAVSPRPSGLMRHAAFSVQVENGSLHNMRPAPSGFSRCGLGNLEVSRLRLVARSTAQAQYAQA